VETIVAVVAERCAQTRAEVRSALDEAGVPTEGQALVHLLAAATLRGHIVRGPIRSGQPAFVGVDAWLGPAPEQLEESGALARLARRFLAGHGPATAEDLARWAGITLRRARAGLAAIAEESIDGADGLVDLADRSDEGSGGRAPAMPAPSLLGAFDPVLHGWVDRSLLVGTHRNVVTTNGLFRPTALVGGRVVGTWGLADGRLRLQLLDPITSRAERSLAREGQAVLRFLGLPELPMDVQPAPLSANGDQCE
jgi:hypothetical protein